MRYAVRRGLLGPDEGDRVLADAQAALQEKGKAVRVPKPKAPPRKQGKKKRSRR